MIHLMLLNECLLHMSVKDTVHLLYVLILACDGLWFIM